MRPSRCRGQLKPHEPALEHVFVRIGETRSNPARSRTPTAPNRRNLITMKRGQPTTRCCSRTGFTSLDLIDA
jgi:hypothetical protein